MGDYASGLRFMTHAGAFEHPLQMTAQVLLGIGCVDVLPSENAGLMSLQYARPDRLCQGQ